MPSVSHSYKLTFKTCPATFDLSRIIPEVRGAQLDLLKSIVLRVVLLEQAFYFYLKNYTEGSVLSFKLKKVNHFIVLKDTM